MKRCALLVPLLLLAGCAVKKPIAPKLSERKCPALSVSHVACVGRIQEGVRMCPDGGHLEEVCEDTQTHGLFDIAMGYNPYQNVDGEDEAHERESHHPWWKFWIRDKHEKDND